MSKDDAAFLELDEAGDPTPDPTPALPPTADDDAFLEVTDDTAAARAARGRLVTDDDLRVVTALADDDTPLLAALWPATPDLLAELPRLEALRERVAMARTTLNLVTRRGAEWRARAEVAGAALTRRLEALRREASSPPEALDEPLRRAACAELRRWHARAIEARVRAEAGGGDRVYAEGARRLLDEARARGVTDDELREIAGRVGVELLPGEMAPWTPCTVLPGAPRTLDAVAAALVGAQAQGVAALRDGSLVAWMRANRAPDALVAAAQEARALAEADGPTGLWSLAWALGREGVTVDGLAVAAPETLLAHLRAARLHASRLTAVAPAMARWFRLRGSAGVASALEALARGEPHAAERLRWSLGDALRLGDRSVHDPGAFARETLARPQARHEALALWRDGRLRAWLDALPRAHRDALWLEELSREHDESAFWRGVYRRVPRAALRIQLGEGADAKLLRFQSVADLRVTARVAAVWEALAACLRAGELFAWLEVASPGLDLGAGDGDEEVRLHDALAAIGHTGLVVPVGRAGLAVASPADLVAAWRRAPQAVEASLAKGHVTAWLRRFHPGAGVEGFTVDAAVSLWGPGLDRDAPPPGVSALRLALLCGLDELPLDPQRPMARGLVRGYRGLDALGRDPARWEPLWSDGSVHRARGTCLLWLCRHAPAFATSLAGALADPSRAAQCTDAVTSAGVPVATDVLATEHVVAEREAARLAAEREAARLEAEHKAAALSAAQERARVEAERHTEQREAERDALRREVEREVAAALAERDAARQTLEQELARLRAERELLRAESEREASRLARERDEARREAERTVARLAAEREAARLEGEREASRLSRERDEARLAAERARLERDIARLESEQLQRRAQRAKELAEQETVEREAARLATLERERQQALEETERLRAMEARCREEAEAESARLAALEADARREAEAESARLAALADEARRLAEAESARLAALEEEARREAARRAEEAAGVARRLAEEARRREVAEQEAEELARRLTREREAAREAAWAARRVAAEREVARLEEAERRARALAAELTVAAPEAAPDPAAQLEALAAIEGALEDPDVEVELEQPEVASLPERREVRHDAMVEAAPLDEAAMARVRAVVTAWARAHDEAGADALTVLEAVSRPAFEAQLTTRMEHRALVFVRPPWRDDDVVPVPPEATAPGASVDPWALELPEVEAWTTWRAEWLLDAAPVRSACPACEGGRVPCRACDATGERACPTCDGRVRIRCPRCAGAGEVVTAKGSARCPACEGRRDQPCPACTFGRAPCPRCRGAKRQSCGACDGAGQVVERVAVVQTYRGVAAVSVVRASLPEALAGEVQARHVDALPVVHLEAPEIDAYALARELPHAALGESVAQLLTEEAARAREGERVTRQRLVVRRYAAAEVRCALGDEAYTLWVHGARDAVYTERSPRERRVAALVARAMESVARGALVAAVEPLAALQSAAREQAEAVAAAEAFGDAVLATARRGELAEARAAAEAARALRWQGCVARLVEAERVVGERLRVRSPWALVEEARGALQREREERCAEHLAQLAAIDPTHPEGRAVAAALGQRLAARARSHAARGEVAMAAAAVARARAVGFAECAEAVDDVARALEVTARAARRTAWLPWAVALVAVAVAVAAIVAR